MELKIDDNFDTYSTHLQHHELNPVCRNTECGTSVPHPAPQPSRRDRVESWNSHMVEGCVCSNQIKQQKNHHLACKLAEPQSPLGWGARFVGR